MRLVLPSEIFEFSPTYKFNIFFLDEAMNLYEQFYANFQSIKLSWILNIPFFVFFSFFWFGVHCPVNMLIVAKIVDLIHVKMAK